MASTINADNGVVSGSSGVKTTADTSGVLALQSNGTTGLTLDTSLNVGVGVTPNAWSSGYRAIQFGPQGVIANDSTNEGFISYGVNFYRNASAQWTYIQTNPATKLTQYGGEFQFLAAPSGTAGNAITWTQILSASKGNTFALEGATSTAGTGIAFPATQSASSNANTLDDYEEGTFTPTIIGGTTAGTGTYDYQIGTYTKIGNMVYFYCRCSWSAHTGTGTMSFSNLPFTISSDTVGPTSVYIETAVTLTAGNVLQMRLTPSTTNVLFAQYATGGSNASAVAFDTSADVRISGQYRI